MLPRVKAEENIEVLQAVAIGERIDNMEMLQSAYKNWIKSASDGKEKPKLTPQQHNYLLASMGIGVSCQNR